MLYSYLAEGKLAEACIHFTTGGLTAEVFRELFQALTYSCGCTDNFHVCDNHMHMVRSHMVAT